LHEIVVTIPRPEIMSDDAANGEEIYAKATKKLKVRIGTLRSRSASRIDPPRDDFDE
jgi:hypothetical protein